MSFGFPVESSKRRNGRWDYERSRRNGPDLAPCSVDRAADPHLPVSPRACRIPDKEHSTVVSFWSEWDTLKHVIVGRAGETMVRPPNPQSSEIGRRVASHWGASDRIRRRCRIEPTCNWTTSRGSSRATVSGSIGRRPRLQPVDADSGLGTGHHVRLRADTRHPAHRGPRDP